MGAFLNVHEGPQSISYKKRPYEEGLAPGAFLCGTCRHVCICRHMYISVYMVVIWRPHHVCADHVFVFLQNHPVVSAHACARSFAK